MIEQKDTVATRSEAVERMAVDWDMCFALLGGTRAMRQAGEAYLPRWPAEKLDAYKRRLAVSVLYPAYQRTVTTVSSKPFSQPAVISESVPSQVRELLDDIDQQGRNIDRFCADVMQTVCGYGLAGILVDYPDASGVPTNASGVRTLQDEQAAGLRPYWVHVRPHQVLGWRSALVQGQWTLRMLRLKETVEEDDGEFAVKSVEQIRVLEPGRWRVYREVETVDAKKEWRLHAQGATTLDLIPFVPCYGDRIDYMMAKPPLMEVAHLNVAHWQSASDQQNILHVARVPILVAKNVNDSMDGRTGETKPWELQVGAGAAVRISGDDCDLSYVEHSGQAIAAGAKDLEELEDRMRQAGAELLTVTEGQKTRIEAAAENEVALCSLQRMTIAFEDALDQAIWLTGRWLGLDVRETGSVKLFKDFAEQTLSDASAQLLLDANLSGKLSDETLHLELKRRGVISDDIEWDDERERIESQGPAAGALDDAPMPGASAVTQRGEGNDAGDTVTQTDPITPAQATAALPSLEPLVEAIRAGFETLASAQQLGADRLAAMAQPAQAQQPVTSVNVTAPAPDMTGIAAAVQSVGAAIGAMQPPQVTVTSPAVTVEGSTTTVNMPDQPAAQITVTTPPINVPVTIDVPTTKKIKFEQDGGGNIIGAESE